MALSIASAPLTPQALEAWDRFVRTRPDAGPMHHAGWSRVLTRCFSVRPLFLRAVGERGAVRGVLPLYERRGWLGRREVVSLPGGILAGSDDAAEALAAEALRLQGASGARRLHLRGGPLPMPPTITRHAVHSVVAVDRPAEALFDAVGSNVRRKIRKAEKEGFAVAEDASAVAGFHDIYAETVHHLGTPVMTRRYFPALFEEVGAAARFFALRRAGELCGGMVAMDSGRTRSSLYVAVRRDLLRLYPTYLLYWHVLEAACATETLRELDLGRSQEDSGTLQFKRQWDSTERRIAYGTYTAGVPRHDAPARSGTRSRDAARAAWRRLPLPLATRMGPALRRTLPFG